MNVIFINNRSQVEASIREKIPVALEMCGGVAESYAKDLCPYKTGRLMNSITHSQISADTEAIGTNVEYAPFVELGTVKKEARPYLRPAVENHRSEYRAIIERVLHLD